MRSSKTEREPSAPARPATARVVRVLPDVSGLDRTFDYLAAPAIQGPAVPGIIVRVPLGGRRVRGWVLEEAAAPPVAGLRPVERVLSIGPAPELVALARFGAERYVGRLRPLLLAGSPPRQVLQAAPSAPAGPAPERPPSSDSLAALVDCALRSSRDTPALLRLPPAVSRLTLVEEVIARCGPAVLVLCPSLSDLAVLGSRLARAGHAHAVHPDEFALAAGGGRVVLGSRAGVFAPVPGLSAIVVLDAHAEAYREERAPTWDATVLAVERARAAGVPCLLVSPAPPPTLLAAGGAVAEPLALAPHEERAGWPRLLVLDRRGEDPRSGLFSPELAPLLLAAAEADVRRPVVAVLNRTGRARLLSCHACGELARCEHCGGALAQRRLAEEGEATELTCPRCGATRPVVCAACGAQRMRLLRIGVTRAAEELAALVRLPVAEVAGRRAGEPAAAARLLVGTEAVLHRVRAASLVVFLDFDQELLAPRYRAADQAMALLVGAARLVGGRGAGGGLRRVVVRARLPPPPPPPPRPRGARRRRLGESRAPRRGRARPTERARPAPLRGAGADLRGARPRARRGVARRRPHGLAPRRGDAARARRHARGARRGARRGASRGGAGARGGGSALGLSSPIQRVRSRRLGGSGAAAQRTWSSIPERVRPGPKASITRWLPRPAGALAASSSKTTRTVGEEQLPCSEST